MQRMHIVRRADGSICIACAGNSIATIVYDFFSGSFEFLSRPSPNKTFSSITNKLVFLTGIVRQSASRTLDASTDTKYQHHFIYIEILYTLTTYAQHTSESPRANAVSRFMPIIGACHTYLMCFFSIHLMLFCNFIHCLQWGLLSHSIAFRRFWLHFFGLFGAEF